MGTMDKLVEDLLRKPQNSLRDELVKRALLGAYHDFKARSATPKVDLVNDLTRFDYRDLARKAMRGEYDDDPGVDDHAMFSKMFADNPALAKAWEELNKTSDVTVALGIIEKYMREAKEPMPATETVEPAK
jgi:hypothetical protein